MENQTTQEAIVVNQVPVLDAETKVTFGAINAPSPKWATWMFRIGFLVTTVLSAYLAATNLLSVAQKYEITLVLKVLIDPLIFGISKLWGIEVDDSDVKKRIQDNRNK